MATWAHNLTTKSVLLLSNRDLDARPFLHGEDYYINTLVSELRKSGIIIDVAIFDRKKMCYSERSAITRASETVSNNTLVILHNVSPSNMLKAKVNQNIRVLVPVYFLWNRAMSLSNNLRTILGSFFWQIIVDEYLVPTQGLAKRMRRLGVFRRITVLPPEYSCPYCNSTNNLKKREMLRSQLPKVVELVYIGSMGPKRISMTAIVSVLNNDWQREYKLTVYTASQVKKEEYQKGNVRIKIVNRRLTERQKCQILQRSHVFVAPSRGTTMEPSISVIEAEYHGNIIVRV